MNSFLTGLGGVVVGVLLATVFDFRSNEPAPRAATPRLDGLEHALARLEVALNRHHPAPNTTGTSPNRASNHTPKGAAPDSVPRIDSGNNERPRPHRLDAPETIRTLKKKPDVLEREVPDDTLEARRKFLLWTVDQIVEKFGRPDHTSVSDGLPAFGYRFTSPQGRFRTIRFVFVGRTVFQIYLS